MKKLISLALSLLLMIPLAGGVVAEDAVSYSLSDVSTALKYIAGWGDEYYSVDYDYNGDNKITIFDAACMLKVIAGWNEDDICLKKPTDEFIKQIQADYTAYMIEYCKFNPNYGPVYVDEYYGTYNGAVPVMLDGPFSYATVITIEQVADSVFAYSNSNKIKVWKDGKFYSLKEAYERGILTKKDVKITAEMYGFGGGIKYEKPDQYRPPA